MPNRILIVGTGLIGASIGLALKQLPSFEGEVIGWDANASESEKAFQIGALDAVLDSAEAALALPFADIYVLATPVLPILDWMEKLAVVLPETSLVTDVGSTKLAICEKAVALFNRPGRARFLPGHPMAGKESGGAAKADGSLFSDATWLFVPLHGVGNREPERLWREWVAAMGANILEIGPATHDLTCAWVSHLPQMLSTAFAALLQDTFSDDPEGMAAVQAIGGRALRETTRLGASPYSMWRDIALTNTVPIADTLLALEQRLQHIRENLRTPQLRDEFLTANKFRSSPHQ